MPELLNAINIEHEGRKIVAEVAQHIGGRRGALHSACHRLTVFAAVSRPSIRRADKGACRRRGAGQGCST